MKEITPSEVANLLKNKNNVSIIDVREIDEVANGKISEATHIPLGEIPTRLSEIDKLTAHIIVCRSGARSARATQYLDSLGYDVTNMVGGMLQWEEVVVQN